MSDGALREQLTRVGLLPQGLLRGDVRLIPSCRLVMNTDAHDGDVARRCIVISAPAVLQNERMRVAQVIPCTTTGNNILDAPRC